MRSHLVVVIPGIGGTRLVDPSDSNNVVWSAGVASIGDILRKPERLSIEKHPSLRPRGPIRSLKAFGVWTVVHGYEGLLARLAALPGVRLDRGESNDLDLDSNVAVFGYDFRVGIAYAAGELDDFIRARLAHLWPKPHDQLNRVLIIAHSMGGLVARLWAGEADNWTLCRGIITLGTPHRGAPKALDVLANGVAINGIHITTKPVPILSGWQSMYDLLPRFPAVTDKSMLSGEGEPRVLRPHELPVGWLTRWWQPERARAAHRTHQKIQHLWEAMPRSGPEVVPRIGYGHGTLRRAVWTGRKLKVSKQPAFSEGLGTWAADLGDGTIPADSGMPIEMESAEPPNLRQELRHGPIGSLDEAVEWVERHEGRPTTRLPTEGPTQRPVVLGVDLEPVLLMGESTEVVARILGTGESPRAADVFISSKSLAHGSDLPPTRLEWDSATETFRVFCVQTASVSRPSK